MKGMKASLLGTSLALIIQLHCLCVLAQSVKPELVKARAYKIEDNWLVYITFSREFGNQAAAEQAFNKAKYGIFDLECNQALEFEFEERPSEKLHIVGLLIDKRTKACDSNEKGLVIEKKRYLVFVSDLKFYVGPSEREKTPQEKDWKTIDRATTFLEFETKTPREEPASRSERKFSKVSTRKESNLYISGELTRASGTSVNGSADIKLEYPIFAEFWNRSHRFTPLFDFKANTDPKSDPDTLKVGWVWKWNLARYQWGGVFQGLWWHNSGLVEAERDFDNANSLWSSRLIFPSLVVGRNNRFYLNPFIGTEIGRNLVSPVAAAEDRAVARFLTGSSLALEFDIDKGTLKGIVLEGSYERRILANAEVGFRENDDKELEAVFFGKGPREWASAKLKFQLSDYFSTFIGYEYGEQPPSYRLVDHRLTIGVNFAGKIISSKSN